MTWNVQNLFLPGTPNGGGPETAEAYDAKIAALAAVIDAARPHLAALQEVGPIEAVTPLQTALHWRMNHLALGEPDARGIRVALLSTQVLRAVSVISQFPAGLLAIQVGDDPPGPAGPATMNQLGRPALSATIRTAGREVTILTCHLKSKLLSYPDARFTPRDENERARAGAYALYRRTSEAVTLRSRVTDDLDDRGRDRAYLLVGDLNDEPNAATTQILSGPPGSEIGTGGFAQPDRGDGQRLWNLAPLLAEPAATRVYRGRGELIDHILVSHALVTAIPTVATISSDDDPLPSVDDDPLTLRNRPGSDHAALLATFTL